jgi:hypothetical protein
MKACIKILLITVVLGFVASAERLLAAPAESTAPANSQINYVDLYYDFDFYAGQPRYAWVIVWEGSDGTLYDSDPYETEQEASFDASFAFGNNRVPIEGAPQRVWIVDYEIVYKEIEPIMEYIATYDTLSEAENAANYFESYGYYTEIDFVSVYQYDAR